RGTVPGGVPRRRSRMHLRRETTGRASSARSTLCARRERDDFAGSHRRTTCTVAESFVFGPHEPKRTVLGTSRIKLTGNRIQADERAHQLYLLPTHACAIARRPRPVGRPF